MHIWRRWLISYNIILLIFLAILIGFVFYSQETLKSQENVYQQTRKETIQNQILPNTLFAISSTLDIQLARVNEQIEWIRRRAKELLEPVIVPPYNEKDPYQQWIIKDPPVTLLTRVKADEKDIYSFIQRFNPLIQDFSRLQERFSFISAAYIIGQSGILYTPARDVLSTIPPDWHPSMSQMFRNLSFEANPERKIMWSPPYTDRLGLGRVISAYAPIDFKDTYAVIGFDIQTTAFSSIIETIDPPLNPYLILIYSPNNQLITYFPSHTLSLIGTPSEYTGTRDERGRDTFPWSRYSLNRLSRNFHVPLTRSSQRPLVRLVDNPVSTEPLWMGIHSLSTYPWKVLFVAPDSAFYHASSILAVYTKPLKQLALFLFLLLFIYIGVVITQRRYLEKHIMVPLQQLENRLIRHQRVVVPLTDFEPITRVAVTLENYQKAREHDLKVLTNYRKRMEELIRTIQEAYVLLDEKGVIKSVNPSFESLFKISEEDCTGAPFIRLFRHESQKHIERQLEIWRERPDVWEHSVVLYDKSVLYLRFNSTPLLDHEGRREIACFIVDLTVLQSFSEELNRWTHLDITTGLLNRRTITSALSDTLKHARRTRKPFSICLLSIDHYEELRTRYQAHILDTIIKTFVEGINLPPGTTAGRYSEHEILVILPDFTEDQARAFADSCREQIKTHAFKIAGVSDPLKHVTISAAIVLFPDHGGDEESLLRALHACIIRAKERGGDRTILFQPIHFVAQSDSTRFDEPLVIINALDEGRLLPYFQPIYRLADRTPLGYEILIRLRDTDGSIIKAGSFIHTLSHLPPADQRSFDRYIWKTISRSFAQLPQDTLFFQNISPVFLTHPDLFLDFCKDIIEMGFSPRQIVFEIPERTFIHDPIAFQYIAEKCHALGFRFAIDDFGTGYTSFQHLQFLPLDFIKIDGEYVRNVAHSSKRRNFVNAFVSLATNLNLQIIAEQIENEDDLETLLSMNVEYGQGFFLSRPITMNDLLEQVVHTRQS